MNYETLRLRPYQLDAQRAILAARERGVKSQLLSLATGLGKTVIIATLPSLLELRPNDLTLVVAHRDELISQIADKMRAQNPDAVVSIEKAEDRALSTASIVVATVQTLTGKRLSEFIARFGRRIALFVIDEAHHAAAPTYRAILDRIRVRRPEALVVGFTATPQRGDGTKLTEIFDEFVYSFDARAAIDAGYLVPVRSYAVASQTDLDGVASRGGDFVLGALAEAVDTEERNQLVLDAYQRFTPGAKALVFTASVEHARNVAKLFVDAGIKAAFASGETKDDERERIVAGFRGSKVDVLVNCGLYLEGFDVPSIEVIINARPTKSATLYTQITGRGLRPLDEFSFVLSNLPSEEARREMISQSRKPYAIVIDIVDHARRHQLITLPFLWGLPSQIDAEGRPISDVAERYERLCELSPREAARVRTAEQIDAALVELDRSNGRDVAAWQAVGSEHVRLTTAPRLTARDRRGAVVANFAEEFERLKTMAHKIAPHENAEAFALRLLGVDRRTIRREAVQIDVMRRDDAYVATARIGEDPPREIATGPNFKAVFADVDAKLRSDQLFGPPKPIRRPGRKRPKWRRRPASSSAAAV